MVDTNRLGVGPQRLPPDVLRRRLGTLTDTANRRGDRTLSQIVGACISALEEWQEAAEQLSTLDAERARAAQLETSAGERLAQVLDLVQRIAGEAAGAEAPRDAAAEPPTGLAARLLGGFEVWIDGCQVVDWRGRRGQAILQFLLLHRDRPVSRDTLVDAVWPDADVQVGRRRLHQGVYALRKTLGQTQPGRPVIEWVEQGYQLTARSPVWTDVAEFERLSDQALAVGSGPVGDHDGAGLCRAAVESYGGDLLPDCPDAAWVDAERERLRSRFVAVAVRLTQWLAGLADWGEVASVTERVLGVDAWNEEAVQLRMRAHLAQGDAARAVRTFRRFEEALARELAVCPSPTTRALLDDAMAARRLDDVTARGR